LARHATHDAEDVVVNSVHADLGCGNTGNGGGRENELEDSVINAREVARTRGLVFLRAKGEGIHVNAAIRGTGVVLEGLDDVEVRALAFREAILAVELELGGDDGVLAPTVHVKSGLGEHESAGIGYEGSRDNATLGTEGGLSNTLAGAGNPIGGVVGTKGRAGSIKSAGHLEEARSADESVGASDFVLATESMDGIGKGIDGISVVEGLGTKSAEKNTARIEGSAVIYVSVRLDNPDKLFAWVVEVELDLVGRRADGLVTSELELFNEVFVGVLCHLAALISVKENVVNVEGCSNKGLLVGSR